ncbi:MAG TPA: translation initiation factor IF-2 N-terminal domain-containing protein, partial [Flavobacterium sp.]
MSEERVIRINKVLRELNISLERAVDYLKDKGIAIEANPNAKISENEFSILQNQFAGDRGNKEASKEVGEEKRKEKEALRLEREKEIEDKRKQDEERQRQLEVIKAKAVVTAPKQVGTIDLSPKKPAPVAEKAPEKPVPAEVPVAKEVIETPAANVIPPAVTEAPEEAAVDESFTTQYKKLSGATLTGQTIDLSQFDKPKKKKEEPKITPAKPGAATTPATAGSNANANANANKNKRKRIAPKPGAPRPPGVPGAANPNKITPNAGGAAARSARPGFVKGNRPAITAKVEPTEEEVKNQIRETLEKLQGKGGKSKAAKYRRDKRDTHRQKSDDEQRSLEEGSKTIKVTEFVTVGEIAIMMDVPITKVIGTCMSLGIMVTMNQRLDAETLS